MASHRLSAAPDTVRWGTFDAAYPPLLTVASGDTVVLDCVSGGPEAMPPPESGLTIPPALAAIHAANLPRVGGHILTGPVAVAGAEPGDMLEVRIDGDRIRRRLGLLRLPPARRHAARGLSRALPHPHPDRPGGAHLQAALGHRAAAGAVLRRDGRGAKAAYGTISTVQPREHGGNLDNKELGDGSTLYLPVWVPGANFSAGDGHGVQGDGEVCINALEICLTGTFTLVLHKGGGERNPLLRYPRAETATHFITMGMNEDLDLAMKQALREMIAFICGRTNLSREQAYQFCSLAVDFHVTQTVNGEKGVHGLLKKGLLF